MSDRRGPILITRMGQRKFAVEFPGGGNSGELSESEARGYALGFLRGVGWAKANIHEPDGIVDKE
jgi:hypothetical protein